MPLIGVIGGSGIYDMPGLEVLRSVRLDTPFGDPSSEFRIGRLSGRDLLFLPRHGTHHTLQPHRINYRANIWGFRELGVRRILSVSAAGGISSTMKPGVIVAPDQIIDMTSGRKATFYEGDDVIHVDFTEPFCGELRTMILTAAETAGIPVVGQGTYLCVNGPRLESAAEIRAFSRLGADMVGMTAMPEAVLARELEVCLGGIAVITNHAAGMGGARLTASEVMDMMGASMSKIRDLLAAFCRLEWREPSCSCRDSLRDSRVQA